MDRPQPPSPDKIRQMSGSFGWVDHRFRFFWEDLSREEILLYFFLVTVADAQSISWWSTRKIAKTLKIGPATLLRAKAMLEQRKLISTRKDALSQRIIYQVLPLPIDENVRIEIPIKYAVSKSPKKDNPNSEATMAHQTDEQRELNMKHLVRIQELLDGKS
jgi:hypothetical protein